MDGKKPNKDWPCYKSSYSIPNAGFGLKCGSIECTDYC